MFKFGYLGFFVNKVKLVFKFFCGYLIINVFDVDLFNLLLW